MAVKRVNVTGFGRGDQVRICWDDDPDYPALLSVEQTGDAIELRLCNASYPAVRILVDAQSGQIVATYGEREHGKTEDTFLPTLVDFDTYADRMRELEQRPAIDVE